MKNNIWNNSNNNAIKYTSERTRTNYAEKSFLEKDK